jgi:branched-subunit amino acid ABC-type transport system permease component
VLTLALDIITTSAILFVVSAGLLIVFGVMKIVNFAHGAFITLGAYAGLIVSQLGLSPWLGLPAAFAAGAICGALVEQVVVRPLYARPLDAILATWGLGIIIGQLLTLGFGREVQFVASPITGAAQFGSESYSWYRLSLLLAALVIGGAFTLLLERTRLGLATRAVIMNEDLARGLGIDSARVRFITFSLGSGLAGLAGALLTPLSSVDPNMGVPWLLNAFMLVMVSGASLGALLVSTLVLGGAQVIVSSYFSPILGGLTIVVLAAVLLRVRPQGFA